MKTKRFSTLAILSVTQDRLLCDIGELYKLLGWMTDDQPCTHQLPRFADECKPWLLRMYPQLADADDEIDKECEAGRAQAVMKSMVDRFGATLEIHKVPRDDHERKNPYDELVAMRGTDEGIILLHDNPETEGDISGNS